MELKALIALALLAVAAWLGWEWRDRSADATMASLQRDLATAQAQAQAKARETEQARGEAVNNAAASYEQGKQDAQKEAKRIADGIADGSLRLRKHWQACEAGRLSDRAATAGELETARQLRAADIGSLHRIGAEADARVKALIEAYEANR